MHKSVNEGTKIILSQLVKETGHVLDVADCDDIFKLNELMEKLKDPSSGNWSVLTFPVKAGNYYLYPLTLSAIIWLEEKVNEWFDESSKYLYLAVPFAMSKSDSSELHLIPDADTCKKEIKAFLRDLNCTPFELRRAVETLTVRNDETENDNNVNFGPIVSLLIREYGENAEYWLSNASIGLIHTLLDDYARRMLEEWEQIRKAAQRNKQKMPAAPTIKIDAIKKQNDFVNELRTKWATQKSE